MPYRIALVEDDELLRANYSQALVREGYIVDSYGSRGEALGAFKNRLPDLAILTVPYSWIN